MNSQIIAIGKPDTIKKIVKDNTYVEDGETFLIHVEPSLQQNMIARLQRNNIEVCPMEQLENFLSQELKYMPYQEYDKDMVYEWMSKGCEYFGIIHSSEMNIFSISGLNVKNENNYNMIENLYFSNSGAIIALVRGEIASFHVNESFDKLVDIKLGGNIIEMWFNSSDEYVCFKTESKLIIYEIKRGQVVFQSKISDFCFTNDGFYCNNRQYKLVSGEIAIKIKCEEKDQSKTEGNEVRKINKKKSFVKADGNRVIKYEVEKKISKIIFFDGEQRLSRTITHVEKNDVFFSKSNVYIVSSKIIEKTKRYSIECFSGNKITVVDLENEIISMAVSDNYFVVFDSAFNLIFYLKNKYSYSIIKTVKKRGTGFVSTMNGMTCFYNKLQSNLEFYDIVLINKKLDVVLKAVYSHPGCTGLDWSHSGLFLASYSTGPSNGLVQIFNINSNLVYTKTFGALFSFKWRPFRKLTEEEKTAIGSVPDYMHVHEGIEPKKDVNILLSEWKSYLISKINDM